jgi:hypothetical protein
MPSEVADVAHLLRYYADERAGQAYRVLPAEVGVACEHLYIQRKILVKTNVLVVTQELPC